MDPSDGGLAVRPMKLKVYYTFDAQHQHNHLAKWPHLLNVHTARQSETVEIGVIDLKTCIEAITSASPELTSLVDTDYTLYAYDYTEDDAPLDSQGRLSNLLEDEENIDDEQGKMVSGLVKKNKMAMLMGSGQEILEVKLRLTPVPMNVQMTSTQRRNSMTSNNGMEFTSLHRQSNAGFTPSAQSNEYTPNSASPPVGASGMETMQQMLSQGVRPRERSGSQAPGSRPPSRTGTPVPNQPSNGNIRPQHSVGSRPSSRAGTWQPIHARRDSFNSGYYSGEDNQEEGPSRKRAKIAPVDYRKANNNIEQQPESLRVAASTASSVRIHRPTPINPATNPAQALQAGSSLEEPVRPPTPVPTKTGRPRGRPPKRNPSGLRKKPNTQTSSPYRAPVEPQLQVQESAITSPEDLRAPSVSSTPANIPSSPPVMHAAAVFPTSPALPELPRLSAGDDSGFMSGNFDDIFGDEDQCQFDEFINNKTDDVHPHEIDMLGEDMQKPLSSYGFPPVFEDGNEAEEVINPFQAPSLPQQQSATASPVLIRAQTTVTPISSLPRIAPGPPPRYWGGTEREAIARANLPPVVASDPAPRPMQRSNTWTGDMSDIPMSDVPTASESKAKATAKKRPGKEQTKQRLEAALAIGELPPYCANCGAIETPAWRRAYSKEFHCAWDEVETSLEDSSCCYKEITKRNDDGTINTITGYKVTHIKSTDDEGWVPISLCNPCGLWFHKSKCHRPPEKWNRPAKGPKKKRNRKKKAPGEGTAGAKSDVPTPASDGSNGSSPAYTAADPDDGDDNDDTTDSRESQGQSAEPELPPMPKNTRANSAEPLTKGLKNAFSVHRTTQTLRRGVQSSPIRIQGSEREPIEIELTPQPLRRQLFPSPDKLNVLAGVVGGEDGGGTTLVATAIPNFVRRSPRLNKTKDLLLSFDGPDGADKENIPATSCNNDGLDDLFDADGGENELLPPMTPTPKRRSERILFKTPGRTPGRAPGAELSPNVQRRHPAVAALLGTSKKVSEMTPFSRSIHEALSDAAEAYAKSSPMRPPPGRHLRTPQKTNLENNDAFDFPDLPSLNGNSPMSTDPMLQFTFSELTTDQLNSEYNDVFDTDISFPSSPPSSFFHMTSHQDAHDAMWSEMGIMPAEMQSNHFVYPDPTEASLNEPPPSQMLRRSPRKKR